MRDMQRASCPHIVSSNTLFLAAGLQAIGKTRGPDGVVNTELLLLQNLSDAIAVCSTCM